MNKLFAEILPFILAAQIIAYLFWSFDIFGGAIQYPLGNISDVTSIFSIDSFSVLLGIGGAALIGVVSLLLKPGTYAIYAMLIWGFGVTFKAVQTFLLVIPNMIGALIPNSINPAPSVFPVNPIGVVITVIVGWAGFWWFMSLVFQRDV